jgi:hypothetical protein
VVQFARTFNLLSATIIYVILVLKLLVFLDDNK